MTTTNGHLSDEQRADYRARFADQRAKMLKRNFYAITWTTQPELNEGSVQVELRLGSGEFRLV